MLNAGIKNRRTKETKDNAEKKTKTHTYGQPTNVPKPTTEQATRKESKEDLEEKPEPAGINKQNKTRDQEKETEKDKKIVYENKVLAASVQLLLQDAQQHSLLHFQTSLRLAFEELCYHC